MSVRRLLALCLLWSVAAGAAAQQYCQRFFPNDPCYEAPSTIDARMSVREARKLIRTLGNPLFFHATANAVFSTTVVRYSYGGFVLQGAANESLKVEYASIVNDPIAATIRTVHGRLATISGVKDVYLIAYNPAYFQHAASMVDAITVLRHAARNEHGQYGEDRFARLAEEYRGKPKPEIGAELRGAMTQVQAAVQGKNFDEAIDLLSDVVARAPWWPVGRWNLAVALAETGDTPNAVHHMKRFMALVPEGPDTKAARELIASWGG